MSSAAVTEVVDNESASILELILTIVKSLVDAPETVDINVISGSQTHVLELRVAKEDIGKVIGRSGRTAEAIRTILNCGAAKFNKRYILQIIEE